MVDIILTNKNPNTTMEFEAEKRGKKIPTEEGRKQLIEQLTHLVISVQKQYFDNFGTRDIGGQRCARNSGSSAGMPGMFAL